MKDLNGEPLPRPNDLVSVTLKELGLPPAGSYKEMKVTVNGGAREGAGRKPSGRHQIVLRLLPKAEKRLRVLAKREGVSLSEAAERMILQFA
jgi:hypothetical protein